MDFHSVYLKILSNYTDVLKYHKYKIPDLVNKYKISFMCKTN